ncbi:MAG: hypothetical protein ABI230_09800 [Aestuariivirga sp.]
MLNVDKILEQAKLQNSFDLIKLDSVEKYLELDSGIRNAFKFAAERALSQQNALGECLAAFEAQREGLNALLIPTTLASQHITDEVERI